MFFVFATRTCRTLKNLFRSKAPLYPPGLDENCAVSKLILHPGYVVNPSSKCVYCQEQFLCQAVGAFWCRAQKLFPAVNAFCYRAQYYYWHLSARYNFCPQINTIERSNCKTFNIFKILSKSSASALNDIWNVMKLKKNKKISEWFNTEKKEMNLKWGQRHLWLKVWINHYSVRYNFFFW